ncbi:MAG: hypothetical protein ACMUHY_04595 [Thermoplasmatota archaeon]
MKDVIRKNTKKLDIPSVLEAIKERMVENRFNIDDYDISSGRIEGRRNNLDKVVLGLNRKLEGHVTKDKDRLEVELKWGYIPRNCIISGVEFLIVAMAVLRSFEMNGFLISLAIGAAGVVLNLGMFTVLRYRMTSTIQRDLDDLENALEEGKRKVRMDLL